MNTFKATLDKVFPGAMPIEDWVSQGYDKLTSYGFTADNTIACVSACRDEITKSIFDLAVKYFGEAFSFSSLAGSLTLGKTGFAAATSHAPIPDGRARYAFLAMPHIGISMDGRIGYIKRDHQEKETSACGALMKIVNDIENDKLDLSFDMDDMEESVLISKVFKRLSYGERPDLVRVTEICHDVILDDLQRLLKYVDTENCDYTVMTGIQIHGPKNTTFVCPRVAYCVANAFGNAKIELQLGEDTEVVS